MVLKHDRSTNIIIIIKSISVIWLTWVKFLPGSGRVVRKGFWLKLLLYIRSHIIPSDRHVQALKWESGWH